MLERRGSRYELRGATEDWDDRRLAPCRSVVQTVASKNFYVDLRYLVWETKWKSK